jgi:hypothetical protein
MLTDMSLAWLSSKRTNKQLTETEADIYIYIYIYPTNGLKLGTSVVELAKGWNKLWKRAIPEGDQQSQLAQIP